MWKEYPCKYVRFSVIIETHCSPPFCFVIAGIINGPGFVWQRQLLTLNEAIEDIKTKRLYGMSKNSLHVESQDLGDSDWSISDTDMYASEDNFTKPQNDTRPELTRTSIKSDIVVKKSQSNSRLVRPEILVNNEPIKYIHSVQRSFDSGYDGSENYQTDIEVTL